MLTEELHELRKCLAINGPTRKLFMLDYDLYWNLMDQLRGIPTDSRASGTNTSMLDVI